MPKYAANLSFMFNEVPFPHRFAAAAKAGFRAVEFLSTMTIRRSRWRVGSRRASWKMCCSTCRPATGRLASAGYLFRLIDELRYDGWVGCEYRPRAGTEQGLGWLKTLV
jgi:hydroxypyruvate isomerase